MSGDSGWLLGRIGEPMVERFGRAARDLAEQIGEGRWDHSLPCCTTDELLLDHAIDMAELVAEDQDDIDCSAEAEAAREAILMDEDVLLLWMPDAEAAFARERWTLCRTLRRQTRPGRSTGS
jgi:hypothetical protein